MSTKHINRRDFLKTAGAAGIAVSLASPVFSVPNLVNSKTSKKVFVLGIDGMDPNLLRTFIRRGEMPTFERFISSHHFGALQTTVPPQSPVAWSSFISGCNPGMHGVYDFIHRDPKTFIPYLSTSRTFESVKSLRLGKWRIPIKGGHIDLLRKGPALWETLEDHHIPATFYKLPANFPVENSKSHMISGMGTPDLLGTYGTYTLFAEEPAAFPEDAAGGRLMKVHFQDHTAISRIEGPENTMHSDRKPASVDFHISRDPWQNTVLLEVQKHKLHLKQGEWSEWIPLEFELLPLIASAHGMVRFYMQQVHPYFRLYMSPINIDPENPDVPISSEDHYSEQVSKAIGRYYTQGFPEDTKALSHGTFNDEEFLSQSRIVFEERMHAFDHELNHFKEGLFFFYFSSIDQNTHMMYHNMDPNHPKYNPKSSPDVKNAVYSFYQKMDQVLKQTLDKMDSRSTLVILSDHGFAPFGREFHLSTWLAQNGWTAITEPKKIHESTFYDYVDWNRTKAYAMGLNGIYLNLMGREFQGAVSLYEYESQKEKLIRELEAVRDPLTGQKIITKAYDAKKTYRGDQLDIAPDIIVGYNWGYRISDEAALGKFPEGFFDYRKDKWAADHCMAPTVVPGVLLANKPVKHPSPGIWDLAPSIIQQFGLIPPEQMDGKSIFT
ncbi:alkaline phosphatase family protein [bacterium]|nr:alkaline phosphatase family protein [bacterium]